MILRKLGNAVTGANVINLFSSVIIIFLNKPLLVTGRLVKACKGQALKLITKICILRTKKFYNIGPDR
jgi:hypothetical protein